jgi:hypothetical protein
MTDHSPDGGSAENHTEPDLVEGDPLAPFLGAGIRALDDEIREARRQDASECDLYEGRVLESGLGRSLYRFRSDSRIAFPVEASVQVRAGGATGSVAGAIVGVEDFAVVLDLEDGLAPTVPVATMKMDAAFVLVALQQRLEAALADPELCGPLPRVVCGLASPMDAPAAPAISALVTDDLNRSQQSALHECLNSSVQFVWGPPGTGKTRTLGHVVAQLAERGERVLVVAHANVAVDAALLGTLAALGSSALIDDGHVVRVGTAQLQEVRDRDDVVLRSIAARNLPAVASALEDVEREQGALLAALRNGAVAGAKSDLAGMRKRRKKLLDALREEEGRLLGTARVIATTSAKSCLDKRIWSTACDAVVVDEASMLGLAPSIAAALMATRRVIFFGDFRQLPPVVLANTEIVRKMLVRDAFAASGAQAEIEAGRDTALIEMLDTQYRMTKPVASIVNRLAYGGRLKTSRRELGDRSGPWKGASAVLVDTSGFGSLAVHDTGPDGNAKSRANPLQAILSTSIAADLAAEGASVALMSPYRSQARLLATACGEACGANPRVATVHRFQGAEADRVVVDLVDTAPMAHASPLTGRDPDMTLRLLNVALSRARDRVFVVADCQFYEEALPKSSPLRIALDALRSDGEVVSADEFGALASGPTHSHRRLAPSMADLVVGTGGRITLNVPYADLAAAQPLADAVSQSLAQVTIHAPLDVAELFEDGPADLRLATLAGGLFALAGDRVLIGTGGLDDPAWEIVGHRTATAFGRLLNPQPGV